MQSDSLDQIVDFGSLPSEEAYAASLKAKAALEPPPRPKPGQPKAAAPEAPEPKASASSELSKVLTELGATDLGSLQHSCRPKPLTESEAEYTVQVIKHMRRG